MASSRTKTLVLRIRPRELADFKKAAERADKTLSEWVREACERLRDAEA